MNRNRKLSKTLAHIADRHRRASGRREVVRRKWRRKWLEIWKVLTSQAFWLGVAISVLATGIPVALMLFMMWWSFGR